MVNVTAGANVYENSFAVKKKHFHWIIPMLLFTQLENNGMALHFTLTPSSWMEQQQKTEVERLRRRKIVK